MKTLFVFSDLNPELERIIRASRATALMDSISKLSDAHFEIATELMVCEATPENLSGLPQLADRFAETPIVLVGKAVGTRDESALSAAGLNIVGFIPVVGAFSNEHLRQLEVMLRERVKPEPRRVSGARRVLLVGAGIVNLVTALKLRHAGHDVRVIDAAAEPGPNVAWQTQGCTFGGGNARMFSFFETRNHFLNLASDLTHPSLRLPLEQGGWLVNTTGQDELPWRHGRDDEIQWMRGVYNDDLLELTKQSYQQWLGLHRELGGLFSDVAFNDEVLRLYETEEQYNAAIQTENAAGSLVSVVKLDALANRHPVFADACGSHTIAGALRVKGFSLRIHDFARNIIRYLRDSGAVVEFGVEAQEVVVDAAGAIAGVSVNGGIAKADDYVFSPGAYLPSVINGVDASVDMHAVAGGWLSVEVPWPLTRSVAFKLSRSGVYAKGAAEGANIFLEQTSQGSTRILISSVHGYIGKKPRHLTRQEYEPFRVVLEDVLIKLFPRFAEHYFRTSSSEHAVRYCHRPWTSNCLGVFSVQQAVNGQAIVTGGHNTGGFAQSAVVAEAVLDAVEGRVHSMHSLYQPGREMALRQGISRLAKAVA